MLYINFNYIDKDKKTKKGKKSYLLRFTEKWTETSNLI